MDRPVVYMGKSHSRELASNDLKKAGVEGFTKTIFIKGEVVMVAPEVAKALIEGEALFGKFRDGTEPEEKMVKDSEEKTSDDDDLEDDESEDDSSEEAKPKPKKSTRIDK